MSALRARCGNCRRSFPEDETREIQGKGGGSYKRAARFIRRRVCRGCTADRVRFCEAEQARGYNTPLNGNGFQWEQAARAFGIPITGLRTNQMSDRRAS